MNKQVWWSVLEPSSYGVSGEQRGEQLAPWAGGQAFARNLRLSWNCRVSSVSGRGGRRANWYCIICLVSSGQREEGTSGKGSSLPTTKEEIKGGMFSEKHKI